MNNNKIIHRITESVSIDSEENTTDIDICYYILNMENSII